MVQVFALKCEENIFVTVMSFPYAKVQRTHVGKLYIPVWTTPIQPCYKFTQDSVLRGTGHKTCSWNFLHQSHRCKHRRSRFCDLNKVSVAKQKCRLLHNDLVVRIMLQRRCNNRRVCGCSLLMETTFEFVASRHMARWPTERSAEVNEPSRLSLLSHQLSM